MTIRSALMAFLALAGLVAGCFPVDYAVTIFATNSRSEPVYLRYSHGLDVRVFEVPSGFSGRVMHFNNAVTTNLIEILDSDCQPLVDPYDAPDVGHVHVKIGDESIIARPTLVPGSITGAPLDEVDACRGANPFE